MTEFAAISGVTAVILIVLTLCVLLMLAVAMIEMHDPGAHWPFSSRPGEQK